MSTTVISQGFIGVLLRPIPHEEREDLAKTLRDGDSILNVNDEGALLFSDVNQNKSSSQREFQGDLFIVGQHSENGREDFIEAALTAGLDIDPETVQPYTCVWYNGSDSPVDMLTKDDFLAGNV